MIKLGVTGGIGSGKSTVCDLFAHLGVAVYPSDEKSKYLIQTDPVLISKIKSLFGSDLYSSEQILDRKKLASIVFNDEEKLQQLNAITHPAVVADFNLWCQQHAGDKYVIKESAILFESGTYKNMDFILGVFAPLELRIKRIQERDHVKRDEILQRMASQMPDNEKISYCDYVIFNDEKHSLIEQVRELHNELFNHLK
jgi:dephospho-CoA kinase